jgi:hypothetical protein
MHMHFNEGFDLVLNNFAVKLQEIDLVIFLVLFLYFYKPDNLRCNFLQFKFVFFI